MEARGCKKLTGLSGCRTEAAKLRHGMGCREVDCTWQRQQQGWEWSVHKTPTDWVESNAVLNNAGEMAET